MPRPDVATARRALLHLATELETLDRRLVAVADALDEACDATDPLGAELAGVARAVHTDLLTDAAATLTALGHLDAESLRRRREAIDAAVAPMAAGVLCELPQGVDGDQVGGAKR